MFEKMDSLMQDVLKMSTMVSQNLKNTCLLLFYDKPFIINDDHIDEMEKMITEKVINIIIRERPFAYDLRLLISTLRIVSDLERIGDLSVNLFHLYPDKGFLDNQFEISEQLSRNLDDAILALMTENVSLAKEIMDRDDPFDIWYQTMYDLYKASDSHLAEMLMVKDIERISDHITNIAEWIVFIYDGDLFSEIKRR